MLNVNYNQNASQESKENGRHPCTGAERCRKEAVRHRVLWTGHARQSPLVPQWNKNSLWMMWSMLVFSFQQNSKENLKTPMRSDLVVPIHTVKWTSRGTQREEPWELRFCVFTPRGPLPNQTHFGPHQCSSVFLTGVCTPSPEWTFFSAEETEQKTTLRHLPTWCWVEDKPALKGRSWGLRFGDTDFPWKSWVLDWTQNIHLAPSERLSAEAARTYQTC